MLNLDDVKFGKAPEITNALRIGVHSLSLLKSNPLCGCAAASASIYQLKDTLGCLQFCVTVNKGDINIHLQFCVTHFPCDNI